ncbi:M91 family zinc metallopeptidase [Nocardia jejuensis]|uniref:M91 family zinc metallopeptidase n=1 Tax=Nocardia jejuensis TaxID=328049 RepID=UPI000A064E58
MEELGCAASMTALPRLVLYHEMAYIYDYMNGDFDAATYAGDDLRDPGISQGEGVAAGLPVDHDHDPNTRNVSTPTTLRADRERVTPGDGCTTS